MADNKNLEKKEVAKKDKEGFGKKISKFFREYKSELKKISWPTLPEVIKNSLVTIAVVVIVGAFIWIVDSALTLGRDALLKIDTNDDKTPPTTMTDINTESDTELIEKIAYYGLAFEPKSASDVPGADIVISGTDAKTVYVVTKNGEIVSSADITLDTTAAQAALEKYAATLDPITTENVPSDSDKQPVVSDTEAE